LEGKIEDPNMVVKEGQSSYKEIHIGDAVYKLGTVVIMVDEDAPASPKEGEDEAETLPIFGLIQYIGEDEDGDVDIQVTHPLSLSIS
jgi:hypothetical protein